MLMAVLGGQQFSLSLGGAGVLSWPAECQHVIQRERESAGELQGKSMASRMRKDSGSYI